MTHIHWVGHSWARVRPVTETSTCTTLNTHLRKTSMPPVGFEPAIPPSERPQTHALGRAATRICLKVLFVILDDSHAGRTCIKYKIPEEDQVVVEGLCRNLHVSLWHVQGNVYPTRYSNPPDLSGRTSM